MAKRTSDPPPIEARVFTSPEIDTGISKLRRRIEQVNGLESSAVPYDDARVNAAESDIRNTIRDVFGDNSPEFREHEWHTIEHGGFNLGDSDTTRQGEFLAGIPQTVHMIEGLIARLEEKRLDLAEALDSPPSVPVPAEMARRVFVVHGHDGEARETVARFLKKLKLEPVILSDQPNEGQTLIEKFEQHSDVSYAVVLLTPDDEGYPKGQPEKASDRARQNVILELGYFVGKLTRKHVCALHKGSIEIPSDYHGVIYIPMDYSDWKLCLAKELQAAGLDVDLSNAI